MRYLVLGVVVALIAACGSSSSTTTSTTSKTTSTSAGVSQGCKAANTQFDSFITSNHDSSQASIGAVNAWLTYDNSVHTVPSTPSSALNTAIDRFNSDKAKAEAARRTAEQDLTRYKTAVASCNQAALPKACQEDFAQHQQLIEAAARMDAAAVRAFQSITARAEAFRAGSASAVNAQTQVFNAAKDDFNAAKTSWNTAYAQHTAIAGQCTTALA